MKKQSSNNSLNIKGINDFALENNINLFDLIQMDCNLIDHINEPSLFKNILLSIEHSKSNIYPSYMNIINKTTSLMRGLYSLGNTGIFHALLMNLFLRSNNENLKEIIRNQMLSLGIENLEYFLNDELVIDLTKEYQKNILNKLDLSKNDTEYVHQINEYYAVKLDELLQEIQNIGIKFGI